MSPATPTNLYPGKVPLSSGLHSTSPRQNTLWAHLGVPGWTPWPCVLVLRQLRIPGICDHSEWGPGIGPRGWWNMEAPRVGPGGEGHIFCVMFYCTPINYSAPYINTSWGLWQGAGVKLGVRVKQGIIKSLEIYFSKLETSCLHLTKSSGWNWSRLPRKTHVTLSHLCLTATHQAAWWILQMQPASSFGSLSSRGLNQTCLHRAHPAPWLLFQGWPKQPLLQMGVHGGLWPPKQLAPMPTSTIRVSKIPLPKNLLFHKSILPEKKSNIEDQQR